MTEQMKVPIANPEVLDTVYPCPHCDKIYARAGSLKSHKEANHWKEDNPKKIGIPSNKRVRK